MQGGGIKEILLECRVTLEVARHLFLSYGNIKVQFTDLSDIIEVRWYTKYVLLCMWAGSLKQ